MSQYLGFLILSRCEDPKGVLHHPSSLANRVVEDLLLQVHTVSGIGLHLPGLGGKVSSPTMKTFTFGPPIPREADAAVVSIHQGQKYYRVEALEVVVDAACTLWTSNGNMLSFQGMWNVPSLAEDSPP